MKGAAFKLELGGGRRLRIPGGFDQVSLRLAVLGRAPSAGSGQAACSGGACYVRSMSGGSVTTCMRWTAVMAIMSFCMHDARASEKLLSQTAPVYEVPADCPSWDAWSAAVRARLPESLRDHPQVARFPVKIERERMTAAVRYNGELGSVSSSPGETRSVRGATCSEVVQALTLIAALEMQKLASMDGAAASSTGAEVGGSREAQPADEPRPTHAAPFPEELRIGAVGFALLQSVTALGWTADIGVGLRVSWQTENLQPWLMVGVYSGEGAASLRDGAAAAHFERWAAHVVGCPLRFPRSGPVAVRPCADLDLGRVTGEGRGARDLARSSALLATAGTELRLEWSILEHIELGAMLGGVVTLSRPRFFFVPEVTALSVAPFGARGGASASLSF